MRTQSEIQKTKVGGEGDCHLLLVRRPKEEEEEEWPVNL